MQLCYEETISRHERSVLTSCCSKLTMHEIRNFEKFCPTKYDKYRLDEAIIYLNSLFLVIFVKMQIYVNMYSLTNRIRVIVSVLIFLWRFLWTRVYLRVHTECGMRTIQLDQLVTLVNALCHDLAISLPPTIRADEYFSTWDSRAGNSLEAGGCDRFQRYIGTTRENDRSGRCSTHHPPRSTRGTRIVRPSRREFGVKTISCPFISFFHLFSWLGSGPSSWKKKITKGLLGAFRRPCEIDFTVKIMVILNNDMI